MRNKIFAFILAGICLVGCSLEEKPYGFYSEGNYYKTEADAQSATMYIYDAINYIEYSRAIVFLGGMNTDELDPKGDATQSTKDLDAWSMNNFRSNVTLGNFFKFSYITINRANAVIENVPGMGIDQAFKDRFTGEAYFMRAYSYFNLARNFGRVPVHMQVGGATSSPTWKRPSSCCLTTPSRNPAAWTRPPPRACWPRPTSTWPRPKSTGFRSTGT